MTKNNNSAKQSYNNATKLSSANNITCTQKSLTYRCRFFAPSSTTDSSTTPELKMSSLAFNRGVIRFSGHRVPSRRESFPVHRFAMITNKSSVTVKSALATTLTSMGKIEEKSKAEADYISVALETVEPADIPSNLCIIDTLQRLGVDRYFQTEIDSILEDTYALWQQRDKVIYSNITTHAMAFRLLRVKGYEVSSEELAPYADDHQDLQLTDVPMVIELYRAAQERIYEDESSLEKLHVWTTTFLKHQLQTNSIADKKLHKLVEYYTRNYHGIIERIGVSKNLDDLYDISYYQTLKASDRFSNLCNEDFLAFARQDFNMCQAQNQKELEQLQRWYADCRLDSMKFGRDVTRIAHFMASAIIGDPEFSDARLALAKHVVLVTRADDFFDHGGSREESYKIIDLVKEWKEKPAAEYGSEKVEILFTAVYNTVNELAEKAHVEQGRCIKEFLIELWVQILLIFKIELDTWCDDTEQSLEEYMSSSWVSIGCRICSLMAMPFVSMKLSDEMLWSKECTDLCKHVSLVDRLLNDVQTFEKERKENTGSSVTILLAAPQKDGRAVSEEEAIEKIKEIVEYNRRKLMQIVYKKGTLFPRKCKDIFLNSCRAGCYVYSTSDEFSSPQQVMIEDMKCLLGL